MALGVEPQDPDKVVNFLCQKFSGLIDRVQAAEAQSAGAEQVCGSLEQTLRQILERRASTRSALEATLTERQLEVVRTQDQLSQTRRTLETLPEEVELLQRSEASLEAQVQRLSIQYGEEKNCAAEAAEMAAQGDQERSKSESECEGLRQEVARIEAELGELQQHLAVEREREAYRRADLRVLEDRAADAARRRVAADRRLSATHEEYCGALRKLTLYKERLRDGQETKEKQERELRSEAEDLIGLEEVQRRLRQEAATEELRLARLEQLQCALETALQENVLAHEAVESAKTSLETTRQAADVAEKKKNSLADELAADVEPKIACAEQLLAEERQRLAKLQSQTEELRQRCESLEMENRGTTCAGETLQAELQKAFEEVEQLRLQKEQVAADCDQLRQRLRAAEPALETAQRRTRDLEISLEDTSAEVGRLQHRKECLLREINEGREKLALLRRRQSKLAETGKSLEKRLVRSSGSFGGFAGAFVVGAGVELPVKSTSSCCSSLPRTPRSGTATVRRSASSGLLASGSEGALAVALEQHEAQPPEEETSTAGEIEERGTESGEGHAHYLAGSGRKFRSPASTDRGARGDGRRSVDGSSRGAGLGGFGGFLGRIDGNAGANTCAASLGYLRQWIELEESRLGVGVARTPPQPSPAPYVGQLPGQAEVPALPASRPGSAKGGRGGVAAGTEAALQQSFGSSKGMGSAASGCRSAAALAALAAGASASEAVALFTSRSEQSR
eukprot:TRINITY_DN11874_c0_g1_i1.p1 TRINITY_DN11874_c0_g1~~TRINITY_DN11874_c0_g1_i1.p1  ORF type:complete len:740 (+),score=229.28 TRINITY_DN11874_c0_g1_i1:126-2345(+)